MKLETTVHRLRFARHDDEGFAMAVVVSIVLLMFIMLAAMILPLTSDVTSLRRVRSVVSERQLAESVFNELFSQAAKTSDLSKGFRMIGRVNAGKNVDLAGPVNGWAEYDQKTGTFGACSGIKALCYFYSPNIPVDSPFTTVEVTTRSSCNPAGLNCVFRRFQQSWRRRTFVDYMIFTDKETLQPELYGPAPGLRVARAGGGFPVFVDTDWAKKHCGKRFIDDGSGSAIGWSEDTTGDIYGTFKDLSRRQTNAASAPFDRYLWPHRLSDLPSNPPDQEDPAFLNIQPTDRRHENCFEIAYTGGSVGDQVNGPIHTNDYWFWYCGSPVFTDIVESTGDPVVRPLVKDRVFKPTTNAGCSALGSPTDAFGNAPMAKIGNYLKLPTKLTTYSTLASLTLTPTLGNIVKVTLLPGPGVKRMRYSLDGGVPSTEVDVPYRGAVYVPTSGVPGNPNVLEIQGEGADATFVSEDDLRVVGDITQPTSEGVTLGFVAGGSITIDQTPKIPTNVPRKDRFVTGAFLSLSGMSVNGWNDVADASLASHPTLHLTGAIIATYRPVFGTYNSSGDLQTGMRKDIQYPKNLAGTEQLPPTPPYFVQPVNAVWVRLDLTETPIKAASPGLTPQPASGLVPTPSSGCDKTWPTTADVLAGAPTAYIPACLVN